jgi:hypothetical protein
LLVVGSSGKGGHGCSLQLRHSIAAGVYYSS